VAKEAKLKDVVAWDAADVDRFLEATAEHRWAVAFRLGALFGLRRSEVLALRWDDVDVEAKSLRIDESLVATNEGGVWSNAKNERCRVTCRQHAGRPSNWTDRAALPGAPPAASLEPVHGPESCSSTSGIISRPGRAAMPWVGRSRSSHSGRGSAVSALER
jgi:integrase